MITPSVRPCVVFAVVLISVMISAPTQAQDLEGKWKTTQAGTTKNFIAVWEFQKSTFTLTMTRADGREIKATGKLKLNEKAEPASFDLVEVKAKIGTEEKPMPDRLGIYSLKDGKLTMRFGTKRPTALEGEEAEQDPSLMVLEKVTD